MGFRRKGRILAFQTLYRYDLTEENLGQLLDFSWMGEERVNKMNPEVKNFAQLLITGTLTNLEEIDQCINDVLKNWEISRIAKVDLANIRLGTFGILYLKDVPPWITIDESVEIAKEFSTNESFKFVNGILDNILKNKKKRSK